MSINKEDLVSEFKKYLEWENESFENWEKVEVFIADTLSRAWLMARPNDNEIFCDEEFKRMVDSANGKWLEKQHENDSYKIILSTKYHNSLRGLTRSFVHEMRHCLDYQNAVKNLPFEEYRPGNKYYNDWSEFRAVYYHTRYDFLAKMQKGPHTDGIFGILAEILGNNAADATMGLMRSVNDLKDTLYFISRYVGASRAVRNLNMEIGLGAQAFHLWHLTPQYIIEKFGYVFYLGNEWDDIKICDLNASPKTYFYNKLLDDVRAQQK